MTSVSTVGGGFAAPLQPLDQPAHAPAPAPDNDARPAEPTDAGDPVARFATLFGLHPIAQQERQQGQQQDDGSPSQFGQDSLQLAGFGPLAVNAAGGQTSKPALGTGDISNIPQADIDKLKHSRNETERRLGNTIENAKVAYGDLIAKGGHLYVSQSSGNGGQPALTITGPGFDPSKDAHVHTHYHGDNATVGDPEGSKAGTNSRIRDAIAHDPQTVFVLPECQSALHDDPRPDSPTHDNGYAADWANVTDQVKTTADALSAAGITKVDHTTVSAHSRGGEALAHLMKDGSGNQLKCDRLEMYDSLYGSQEQVAQWGKTPNGQQVQQVVYVHGTNKDGRDGEFGKVFQGKYTRVDIADKPALTDQTNPVVYQGKDAARSQDTAGKNSAHHKGGQDTVRQFDPNAHYRTTGEFLGSDFKPGTDMRPAPRTP